MADPACVAARYTAPLFCSYMGLNQQVALMPTLCCLAVYLICLKTPCLWRSSLASTTAVPLFVPAYHVTPSSSFPVAASVSSCSTVAASKSVPRLYTLISRVRPFSLASKWARSTLDADIHPSVSLCSLVGAAAGGATATVAAATDGATAATTYGAAAVGGAVATAATGAAVLCCFNICTSCITTSCCASSVHSLTACFFNCVCRTAIKSLAAGSSI
jgi:hypothetical protein